MKSIKHFLALVVFSALVSGCGSAGTKYLKQSDSEFILQVRTTPCMGTCPVYELAINSSGRATYIGKEHSELKGKFQEPIPVETIDSLRQLLIDIDYLQLDSAYNDPYLADLPSTHFRLISEKGQIDKKVLARMDEPEGLLKLKAFIERLRLRFFSEP